MLGDYRHGINLIRGLQSQVKFAQRFNVDLSLAGAEAPFSLNERFFLNGFAVELNPDTEEEPRLTTF